MEENTLIEDSPEWGANVSSHADVRRTKVSLNFHASSAYSLSLIGPLQYTLLAALPLPMAQVGNHIGFRTSLASYFNV